jgi:hypothetical protein
MVNHEGPPDGEFVAEGSGITLPDGSGRNE